MVKIAVLIAEGFEEIEAMTIIDLLRRAEIDVDVVGIASGPIKGAHDVKMIPETTIDDYSLKSIDALLLPGGAPGWINLRDNQKVIQLIKEMNNSNKLIGAICAAPAVLAKAGILKEKRCTIYPGLEEEVRNGGAIFKDKVVVIDENIITSTGPATAIPFSLTIIEELCGKERVKTVNDQILADLVLKK